MVQQGAPLSPPTPRRPRPSKSRIALRRGGALFVLAGGFAMLIWLASLAVGSVRGSDAPKRPAAPAAPRPLRILFPEGFTRREMAERITAVDGIAKRERHVRPRLSPKGYLAVTASSALPGRFAGDGKRRQLEGFLFPATYDFTPTTTSRQLVMRQLATFRRKWSQVDLGYARSRNLTPYDVLIIASMVEKEVIAPEERALVAAVIYNRLHAGMVLGIDAMVRYGLNVPPTQSLTDSELNKLTPYNTRRLAGLTPTPIANPGLASMQAAAHPAKVDYLYFVRKPDRIHHFFTASEREFENYKHAHGYR